MSEAPSFVRLSTSSQGLEVIPPDEPLNQQYPDPPSPRPSSSYEAARIVSEPISRGECSNQQVLPENTEISRPQPPLRISRVRDRSERSECGSIIIPVGGTLSRPTKKQIKLETSETDFKATLKERNSVMFLNEWLADVHFIVGERENRERIPVHSYVLSIASGPFNAMFHGGFEKLSEIEVPDIDPTAFKILLRYLYTDEVEIKAESALQTLYASKKYLINYLIQETVNFLDANLSADNVCAMLMQSRLFEDEVLIKRCWEVVDARAEKVLRSEGFKDIDFSLFEQILSRETLIVRERTVFEAALNWAKAECKRVGATFCGTNIRKFLGDSLYHIRFPAMTISEFANGPARSELLTCQEINNIFLHFAAEEKPGLPFPTVPRSGLPLRICTRFQAAHHGTNQWRYRGRCDSIQFCVDRRVFVAGYGLYGSSNGPSEYKVKMELKKEMELLESVETSFYSTGLPDAFPIFFQHPVQVEADIKYTASVTIEGKELSHFGQEGMSEVGIGIYTGLECEKEEYVNFFFSPSADSKNGTGVQGGQIPDIMFYIGL